MEPEEVRPRIRGSLLAGAVGDALGAPVEFLGLAEIRDRHGAAGVTGYLPAYGRSGGAITDDTQMTLFTAEGLLVARAAGADAAVDELVASVQSAYLRWLATQADRIADRPGGWLTDVDDLHRRRAPGSTCMSALGGGRAGSDAVPLNDSKGCGGVMRVAPVGAAGVADPFEVAARCAALTHGHPSGYLSAGVLGSLVASLLDGADLGAALDRATVELAARAGHEETALALRAARELADRGRPTPEQLEGLGGGWVGEEALAIAVCAALVADDLADGLLLAVNHSGDSDSTGAIAGNLLGAIHGDGAIPDRWLAELELVDVVTTVADDLTDGFHGDGDGDGWRSRYPPP